ncbi:NAD(P)H-binding protein [Williamsia soli]|uniref:NAD(P)H-binding protein n=1 Tax=Williamsia soli TaxID=364929 RepID=UPI001A9DAB4E|nr:NAD(P)H-binding protein [Williamsia soli]
MRAFVTGSTGYIGSRLIPALLESGHDVVAGMRDPDRASEFGWADAVQVRRFDLQEPEGISAAIADTDVAYFLVHSMDDKGFEERDAAGAHAFADACDLADTRQIVYLSGLIPEGVELSDHLASRQEVERIFLDADTPANVQRAALIVGAGSTSFELVRRLVERLPVLPIPKWMNTRVQPIATEDVIAALVDAGTGEPTNGHHDLGGPDQLSYPELIGLIADELDVRRPRPSIPGIPTGLVGRVAAAITGIPRNTVVELVDSLRHDMICGPDPRSEQRLSTREAVRRSLNPARSGTDIGGDHQTADRADPA